MVGGDWSVIARQAAVTLVAESKNVENKSLGIRLLADLKVAFGDRLQMTTKDLLIGLQAIDEAPHTLVMATCRLLGPKPAWAGFAWPFDGVLSSAMASQSLFATFWSVVIRA
jgi:Protein of unknown function (DUF3631)